MFEVNPRNVEASDRETITKTERLRGERNMLHCGGKKKYNVVNLKCSPEC